MLNPTQFAPLEAGAPVHESAPSDYHRISIAALVGAFPGIRHRIEVELDDMRERGELGYKVDPMVIAFRRGTPRGSAWNDARVELVYRPVFNYLRDIDLQAVALLDVDGAVYSLTDHRD